MLGNRGVETAHGVAGRVSVVMPAYDAAATIVASMRSVLGQTYRDVELLVVDDCSRDDTWALIRQEAASDVRVVSIRQPTNGGVASARNAGIEAASGQYVAFLDSDDSWHPMKLEIQLAAMLAQGAKVGYAAYERVDGEGNVLSIVRPPARVDYADMLKGNSIGNLTGLYERGLGDFRFRRMGHEDYAFWLDVVRAAGDAVCADADRPLACYLVRPGSLSSNKLHAARWQWRIYRDSVGLGVVSAGWCFLNYAARAVLKRV